MIDHKHQTKKKLFKLKKVQDTITSLCFLSDNVKNAVDQLGAFSVMALAWLGKFSMSNMNMKRNGAALDKKWNPARNKQTQTWFNCRLGPIVSSTCRAIIFGNTESRTILACVNSRCHCVQREGNVFSLVVASRLVELHSPIMTTKVCSHIPLSHKGFRHALAHKATTSSAPVCPNTKLSGRNNWPNGPARTLSIVPAIHGPTHC